MKCAETKRDHARLPVLFPCNLGQEVCVILPQEETSVLAAKADMRGPELTWGGGVCSARSRKSSAANKLPPSFSAWEAGEEDPKRTCSVGFTQAFENPDELSAADMHDKDSPASEAFEGDSTHSMRSCAPPSNQAIR